MKRQRVSQRNGKFKRRFQNKKMELEQELRDQF